jgi:hypothetical protein
MLKLKHGQWRNSTGTNKFNPTSVSAFSYDWWQYVAIIDGLVVFNTYRYSNTTSRHQSEMRRLLDKLGVNIDIEVSIGHGLQAPHAADLVRQLIIEGVSS